MNSLIINSLHRHFDGQLQIVEAASGVFVKPTSPEQNEALKKFCEANSIKLTRAQKQHQYKIF